MFATIGWDIVNEIGLLKQPFFLFSSRKIRIAPGLDSVQPGFSGPDPDRFLDVGDEDLAVADAPGLGRAPDRVDRLLDQFVAITISILTLGRKSTMYSAPR